MEIIIITSLLGDFSKIAEEIEKELKDKNTGPEKSVRMKEFDMISRAYDAKCDECKKLISENRKLTEQLSRYRYFIECQKNEIEKL